MAVVSVPKPLDRVKKSLECLDSPRTVCVICLKGVVLCYYHKKITCLCDVVGGSKADCRIVP